MSLPKLNFAHICDSAFLSKDNKLNIRWPFSTKGLDSSRNFIPKEIFIFNTTAHQCIGKSCFANLPWSAQKNHFFQQVFFNGFC